MVPTTGTIVKPPLTEEEKARIIEELKELQAQAVRDGLETWTLDQVNEELNRRRMRW